MARSGNSSLSGKSNRTWKGRQWCEGEWSPLVTLFLEEIGTPCPQLDSKQSAGLAVGLVDIARQVDEVYLIFT